MSAATERVELAAAARLFGDLLLFELDAPRLLQLQRPALRAALAELGLGVPAFRPDCPRAAAALEELAAEYFAALLSPTGGDAPPIQSLWTEGRYDGDAAARLAQLARAGGLGFEPGAARSAPLDHLGSILHLWALASERDPALADQVTRGHLAWARRPLGRLASREGFYAELARATLGLCEQLLELAEEAIRRPPRPGLSEKSP